MKTQQLEYSILDHQILIAPSITIPSSNLFAFRSIPIILEAPEILAPSAA